VNPWPGFKPGFKPATNSFARNNDSLCSFFLSDAYVATRYSIFDFSFSLSADRRGKFLSTTSSASAFFLSRQALFQLNSNGQGRVFSFFLRFTRPDIARYPRCFVSSFFSFQLASFSLSLFFSAGFLCFIALRGDEMRQGGNISRNAKQQTKTEIYPQKLQRRQYAGSCCFYLQTNSLPLSPHLRVLFFFFFFLTRISMLS
jgi:hypothetical protein